MRSRIATTLRKIISVATTAMARKYIRKDRWYRYKDLRLKVYKDVFHPGLFRSTKVFAEWTGEQDIKDKKILEIGSGSGLISLVAAQQGAIVTAIDINPKAVENTRLNAGINELYISVYYSDLFSKVPAVDYDLILINPPYYPMEPQNDYEKAWYCGEGFAYFNQLFCQLAERGSGDKCYMILSDTCDLQAIQNIAVQNRLRLTEIKKQIISGETLVIYKTATLPVA
jgi:release factor glutamine methyltransferase